MDERDIEAHVESRTNPELTELVRRLHHVHGFETTAETHGGEEFVFYSASASGGGPDGVLWVLGTEPPREDHVQRLRNVREHAGVERAGLVAKREPWAPLDETGVELLTPETLASTIAGLDDPTEVVPADSGQSGESDETSDAEDGETAADRGASEDSAVAGSWAATTTNGAPAEVTGEYWNGQTVRGDADPELDDYWDSVTV